MCLVAATTFWFLNALNKDYSTRISYPIKFDYNDSAYVSINPLPTNIRLNVSGYGWNLLKKTLQVGANGITYRVTNPLRTPYITATALMVPITEQIRDIRVNYVVEDTLFFNFDKIEVKEVILKVDSAALDLESSYRVTSAVSISPQTVRFKGPVSLLQALSDTVYLKIPYKGIDENFTETIPVNYLQNSLIDASATKATVSFAVAPFVKETQLVPIAKLDFPAKDSVVLGDNTLEVSYWLRRDEANKVRPEDFRLVADYKSFNKADSTVKIFLEQKPGYVTDIRVNKIITKVHYVEEED